MLASYLYGDITLGSAEVLVVLVVLDWCLSVVYSKSACFLFHEDNCCFQNIRVQTSCIINSYANRYVLTIC